MLFLLFYLPSDNVPVYCQYTAGILQQSRPPLLPRAVYFLVNARPLATTCHVQAHCTVRNTASILYEYTASILQQQDFPSCLYLTLARLPSISFLVYALSQQHAMYQYTVNTETWHVPVHCQYIIGILQQPRPLFLPFRNT